MYSIKAITSYIILITAFITINTKQACAQLTGMQSFYFDNEYLANPAMAGLNRGLHLNIGYQQQWTSIPGSPKLQDLTADYNTGNRVGLGFIINSDQSGLISRTRIMGTYAYHLPVNETGKLNFGLSAGVNDTYIDYKNIVGDQSDVSAALFNQRRIYVDGDLGIAYTDKGFEIQASIPNLGSVIFNTEGANLNVDRSTFFTAVSYKFPLSTMDNAYMIEPKLVYRGIKGFKNIADAGVDLMMNEYNLNISVMYHTNKSFSTGVGLDLKPVGFLFAYSTNTGPLAVYANNTFEFGIKYTIFDK